MQKKGPSFLGQIETPAVEGEGIKIVSVTCIGSRKQTKKCGGWSTVSF